MLQDLKSLESSWTKSSGTLNRMAESFNDLGFIHSAYLLETVISNMNSAVEKMKQAVYEDIDQKFKDANKSSLAMLELALQNTTKETQ